MYNKKIPNPWVSLYTAAMRMCTAPEEELTT